MKIVAEREVDIPENLTRTVAKRLREEATASWDDAIATIAREAFGQDE
jgi:hypothetical protein